VSLTSVFLTGLLAGGASCAAVQGGLLAGVVARQRDPAGQPAPARAVAAPRRGNGTKRPTAAKSARARAKVVEPPRPVGAVLADDLAPVSGFLAGKLVSHTLLGAALGALGGAVQLGPGTRAIAQIAAGALMVVLAMAQLGVPGFRRFRIEPPAAWSRLVRARARSSSAFAPAVLGVATVLIPCGVTLSVELLAATTGSPLLGAATMAVFVLGTAPLFAVLGYAARRAAGVLKGRLAVAAGVVVLVLGLVTINTGLELSGSPVTAKRALEAFGSAGGGAAAVAADSRERVRVEGGRQTVVIDARDSAYSPDALVAAAGLPTTLLVRTNGTRGCTRSLVLPSTGQQEVLPVTGETQIDLGTPREGRFDYTCGMGMYSGRITFTKAGPTPTTTASTTAPQGPVVGPTKGTP